MESLPTLTQVATTAAITAYREYGLTLSSVSRLKLYAVLLEMRLETRTYYMDDTQAQLLWGLFREDDDIMDFFIRGAVLFRLQFPDSQTHPTLTYDRYVRQLTEALCSVSTAGDESQVTDVSFSSKLSKGDDLGEILSVEGWLVYLLTLEMVLTSVVPAAVQRAWRSGAEVTDSEETV